MKSGWKTTEFWLAVIVVLLNQALPLAVYYGLDEQEITLWRNLVLALVDVVGSGLAVAAYAYSRARVKSAFIMVGSRSDSDTS